MWNWSVLLYAFCKFFCELIFQVEKVVKELQKTFPTDGLLPIYINPLSGTAAYSTITFGAMGDRY